MTLDAPFYSQYDNVTDESWRSKACAVTCLKMGLDFLSSDIPSIDSLIEEGVSISGYTPHGWSHDSLVFLAHNHGVPSYKEEFRSASDLFKERLETVGLSKIIKKLAENRPVLLSVTKPNDSFHAILAVGFEGETASPTHIIFHDPDTKDGGSSFQKMTLPDFLKKWRKLAIFLG
ncbi:MAG: C39 family peptidase [Patescibacteria group bacterium]|nr:C39 family peptidase [bacterium]MDZ4240815.1 C39 family peptidase [Patescibacteria group bacterium]